MKDGQKYLLLRFSIKPVSNCIQLHKDVIDEIGYCWFGKIGSIPSQKILDQVFLEEEPTLVLCQKNKSYVCNAVEYCLNTPENGVPKYYDDICLCPSIYFKINAITACDDVLFHNSIVNSTGTYVEDVMSNSRIPFMLCSYTDESKQKKLDENECRYRKEGFCTYRTCVSYNCLCERPKNCIKQRR